MTQIILKEDNSSQAIELTREITAIGRSSKNDIVIAKGELSRFHCQIRKSGDSYLIVDLDSRNGIHFRGERIKERKLEPGDEISIGKATLVFERELPKPEPSPATATQPPAGLAADEFVTQAPKHVLAVAIRTLIIISGIGIVMAFGYIKLQERAELALNIISKGSSFEQPVPPPNLPGGWQLTAETKARIALTDREPQDGKYALMVEKSGPQSEFCTELLHTSIIKIPSYVRSNPKEIYTFGGWIKSDQFRKSLSGYKISWFDDNQRLIRNDYTEFTRGTKDWLLLTAQSNPPPKASYGRFSAMVLGSEALVHLDNVSVLQKRAETEINTAGKINKAVLDNQTFKLTVFQSGIWELEQTRSMGEMELNGELVFRPDGRAESRQSFYNQSRILAANNERIRSNAQILDPVSLEMININAEFAANPAMSVTYNFPPELYPALRDKYFSLFSSLPAGSIRYLKLIGESGIREISLYEKTTAQVSGINIGFPNNIVSIRYLQPIELSIDREGEMLQLTQTIRPMNFGTRPESNPAFGLEFELKTLSQNQGEWEQMFRRAEELEANNNLGEAIELYRSLAMEEEQALDIAQKVQTRLSELESNARTMVQNAADLLYTARLLNNFGLYENTSKLASEISKIYRGSEYADQARDIGLSVKSETVQIKEFDERQSSEKMLLLANGFAGEKNAHLATWLYNEIIRRYPGSPAAKQAEEKLAKPAKE